MPGKSNFKGVSRAAAMQRYAALVETLE